jgi:hypothetical protein
MLDVSQALVAIERVLKRRPCFEYLLLKMKILIDHGRDERRAGKILKTIIAKYPEELTAFVDYADGCYAMCSYDRALNFYLKFVYSITGSWDMD